MRYVFVAKVFGTILLPFFPQIDGQNNPKLQSIFLERFPIHTAHFTADGEQVILASQRRSLYVYDMIKGSVIKIPRIRGILFLLWYIISIIIILLLLLITILKLHFMIHDHHDHHRHHHSTCLCLSSNRVPYLWLLLLHICRWSATPLFFSLLLCSSPGRAYLSFSFSSVSHPANAIVHLLDVSKNISILSCEQSLPIHYWH